MGNVNTVENKKNKVINKNRDEIEELVDNINLKANELLNEYKEKFLNKEFCKHIELAFTENLGKLDVEKLRNIHNKIETSNNKKLEVYLKYEPTENELFVVNELQGKLIDNFYDRAIELNNDNIKLGTYIKYIHPSHHLTNMKGGQNNNTNYESELKQMLEKNNKKYTKANKQENINNNNDNNNDDKLEKTNLNIIKKIEKEIKINKTNEKKIKRKDKKINANLANLTQLNDDLLNNKEKININKIEKQNAYNNSNKWINELYKVQLPVCNTGDCKLTKKQLCQAIAKNYLIRANIISAILTTLPKKDTDKYKYGFCHDRLKSLEEFKICLPKDYTKLLKMNKEQKINELVKYINQTDGYKCHKINGLYKELNEKERSALKTGNNEFNVFYRKFTTKLREQYKESLESLLVILDELTKLKSIKTELLNEVSNKAKIIIDSMYSQCQFNYIYAVLAYLNADLETTRETLQRNQALIDVLSSA